MTECRTSAPGKLLLTGEYAVLRNAPAIVMAVNRRAVVHISRGENSAHAISTPGLREGAWRFEIDDKRRIAWLDEVPDSVRLLPETVLRCRRISGACPVHIDIDTRAFSDPKTGSKLGLGSSAAATVALVAALSRPDEETDHIWSISREAHHAMQGGSGADVAASCFGGLLVYRHNVDAPPETLDWPLGLHYRIFNSGVPASTSAAVERSASGMLVDEDWAALGQAAERAAAAWCSGQASRVLESVRVYRDALRRFDLSGSVGIFSAGHETLTDLGDSLDVVYKPSGAGAGDCGIAMAMKDECLDRFGEVAMSRGFVPLDVERDNSGV